MVGEIKQTIRQAYQQKNQSKAGIIALSALMKLRQICVSPQLMDETYCEMTPKIDYLVHQLTDLTAKGHSALVFSQFLGAISLTESALSNANIRVLRMDGKVPTLKRQTLVSEFQNSNEATIFLISLKTGGVGLNLTRASYVFHVDPWWNPAVENQASDRAHRMGQENKVIIQRLIMKHSIEEKIMKLKEEKRKLFDCIFQNKNHNSKSITKEDFEFLLS